MMQWIIVTGIVCHLAFTPLTVYAAPSVEACPPDSILSDNVCICNLDFCIQPNCQWNLEIAVNGSDVPGSCCPIYSCEGCKNESAIDDKCPCAPGATINEKGICECVDKERHLVDGACVCNPQQCELPQICDRKHVLTAIEDGCCRKTRCLPCPEDSESTNLESDDIEDHCVCLPCKNDCGFNKTIVVKKKGTGFPGNCCDLYECKPLEENEKDCVVGDIIYANGETWSTADKQECQCQNGLSLCATRNNPRDCVDDTTIIKHATTWRTDNDCTGCTCFNGEIKCISHFCDFKETKIKENASLPCTWNDRVYEHLKTWINEKDNCTLCQCFNGVEHCNTTICDIKEVPERNECHPLSDCNKQCPNGFRINKKGCEICKCNSPKVSQELLNKYNITFNDLVNILDDYIKQKTTSTEQTTSSITSSTTTTSTTTTTTEMPIVTLIKRNGNELDKSGTEATVTQACVPEIDKSYWIVMAAVLILLVGIAAAIIGFLCYKKKSRQSMEITSNRGSYQPVTLMDNNNTIKKNSICYD